LLTKVLKDLLDADVDADADADVVFRHERESFEPRSEQLNERAGAGT
jgi:hypothetical protein